MNLVVYSLLQGLLEWLPVSSSGVLVLLGMSVSGALGVHLATGLAGLAYTGVKIRRGLRSLLLSWGVVPLLAGAPVAFILDRMVEGIPVLVLHRLVAILYAVTAVALLVRFFAKSGEGECRGSRIDPIMVGLLQGIAVLPGVSRSGVVSAYLLLRGYKSRQVVDIVIVSGALAGLAAGAYEVLRGGFTPFPFMLLTTFTAALASAYLLDLIGERGRMALTVVVLAGLFFGLAVGLLG